MTKMPPRPCKEIEEECRALVHRYALMSAASSALPIPGLDVAVDLFNMTTCLNAINKKFGLAEEDIAGMSAQEKVIFQSLASGTATMLGQKITTELVTSMLLRLGMKAVGKQFTRYVPFIGPAISASVGYKLFSTIGNKHVDDCLKAARKLGRCTDSASTPI